MPVAMVPGSTVVMAMPNGANSRRIASENAYDGALGRAVHRTETATGSCPASTRPSRSSPTAAPACPGRNALVRAIGPNTLVAKTFSSDFIGRPRAGHVLTPALLIRTSMSPASATHAAMLAGSVWSRGTYRTPGPGRLGDRVGSSAGPDHLVSAGDEQTGHLRPIPLDTPVTRRGERPGQMLATRRPLYCPAATAENGWRAEGISGDSQSLTRVEQLVVRHRCRRSECRRTHCRLRDP